MMMFALTLGSCIKFMLMGFLLPKIAYLVMS